jgi:pectin methylesterase-like acyl-CoA thioesterase
MVSATILPTTAVNGSQASSLIVHAPATGSTVAITAGAAPDFTVGSPACITNTATDKSVDCTAVVTYAPKSLAQRSVPISIATTVSSITTTQNESLTATSTGSALVFDTLGAPSLATFGSTATGNTAVALDRYGSVYVSGTQGISKVNGSNVTNISATPAGYLAVDTSGNVYATASGSTTVTKYAYSSAGGGYSAATISIPSIPINGTGTQAYGGPIAVDSDGVVYLTDLTNKQVVKFTQGSLVGQQLTQIALTSPAAMTQDSYGNLLVIDGTTVLKIPSAGVPFTTANTTPVANPTVSFPTALVSPNAIAVDQAENIYVTDSGNLIARTLSGYEYTVPLSGPAVPTSPLASSATVASTTTFTLTNPTDTLSGTLSIAVGSGAAHSISVAGGSTLSSLSAAINADSTYSAESVTASLSSNVLTISGPVAASNNLVLTGTSLTEKTPIAGLATAVAVDGTGDLYLTASSVAGLSKVLRNAESNTFGTDVSDSYVGVFANTGATAATGFIQTDTGGNYTVSAPTAALATGAPTCVLTSTALAGGGLCNASVTFSPTSTGSGDTPNVISLLPSTNTLGALSLDGTKNGSTATTMTFITGNTAGLVYSTGTETTFTVTVTQSAGSPSGQVTVYIDSNAGVNYTLGTASGSSASVNVPISGATATSHTIYAVYAGSAGIAGSTSSTTNFTVAQATTSVSWTPARTSIQYSSPISLTVLNATAASGGNSVPGTFVYTANSAEVNAASYLAINTYSLGVTFYPTDSLDYSGSTGSVSNFVVQQATTTAPIGGSQVVVGSTGNYSSVQAAINALPVTGGSVYIQPGTYTGDVTVTQPNVALRGLGGDPTKVIITHPGGAFSVNPGSVYNYAGEFTTAISNGYQLPSGSSLFSGDQGSATLVVARGINTAVNSGTTTPNGFYGENLTLANTWDTDSTLTTTYVSGGVCTAGAGAATSYSALYNAGTECASQALAIWITSDLAVLNNVYTTSLQDTVYAGAISTGSAYPARQFWFRGKITGDVDYIFGDAAAVFDHTSVYSAYHNTATGTVTIEAQNKAALTGSSGDYLSGYVMNSDVFTSQNSGMTSLYFGRPYGTYSTWIMLNSYIDQVNALGYIPFSGSNVLTYATYGEYNDHAYTDPSNGSPDTNGVTYLGTSAASSGSGVLPTSARESASTDPGYAAFSANGTNSVGMTQAQAQQFYPLAFLGKTITTNQYNTVATWDPTAAIAADVNGFVPSSSPASITSGQSITLMMRPQTPGLGAVSNGVYTIPTGTYIATENGNTIASGTLDASGAAYFTISTLTPGVHNFKWTYSGDSNFAGSTTASAYSLTVTGAAAATTTVLTPTPNPATYGQSVSLIATVLSGGSAVNSGTVSFTVDGVTVASYVALNGSGQASTSVNGLAVGTHSVTATFNGAASYSTSFSSSTTATVNQATLTITGSCSNRVFGAANICSAGVSGYKNGDNAAAVFTSAPTGSTTAVRTSPANTYTASVGTYTLSTLGSTNYTVSAQTSTFTISGGAPQSILFAPLPNFASGASYQLTASTTSGLPVSYTVTVGNAIASVSGSTLTVSGPGPVTVQALQSTDPTGDYAAATPVSRSFTAQ